MEDDDDLDQMLQDEQDMRPKRPDHDLDDDDFECMLQDELEMRPKQPPPPRKRADPPKASFTIELVKKPSYSESQSSTSMADFLEARLPTAYVSYKREPEILLHDELCPVHGLRHKEGHGKLVLRHGTYYYRCLNEKGEVRFWDGRTNAALQTICVKRNKT